MPILVLEPFMLEKLELENYDILFNLAVNPPRHNLVWGQDYILMDSHAFMGSASDDKYEKVIDMFMKIWNQREYSLLNNL